MFLLSGKDYNKNSSKRDNPMDYEYPDDCMVDFDFRMIDIFKTLAESGVNYIEVNNDEDFAKSVTNIIVSIPKLKEMAKQAKIIGNRNYSKERFIEIVKTEVISKFPQK